MKSDESKFAKGDRVTVVGIGDGVVINIRDLNGPVYTIDLDNSPSHPLFVARAWEIREAEGARR